MGGTAEPGGKPTTEGPPANGGVPRDSFKAALAALTCLAFAALAGTFLQVGIQRMLSGGPFSGQDEVAIGIAVVLGVILAVLSFWFLKVFFFLMAATGVSPASQRRRSGRETRSGIAVTLALGVVSLASGNPWALLFLVPIGIFEVVELRRLENATASTDEE